jgi:Holliday junction resolvase RusA-like endonuclease
MASRTPPTVTADDFMVMMATKNDLKTIYVTVDGSPPVQARPRIRAGRGGVCFYDPSARSKRAFKRALLQALRELGIYEVPIMRPAFHLRLTVTFFLSNVGKDVDNLLKYLMDALQSIVCANDAIVFKVGMGKEAVDVNSQFTRFEIEELP